MQVWKRVSIFEAMSENGCWKWHFLVWNWVWIWTEMRAAHPTKNFKEYPPPPGSFSLVLVLVKLSYNFVKPLKLFLSISVCFSLSFFLILILIFNLATCKCRVFRLFQNLPKYVWWKVNVYRPNKRQDSEGKWSPHSVIAVNPSVGRQPWDFYCSVLAKQFRTILISDKKVSENRTVRTFFVYT